MNRLESLLYLLILAATSSIAVAGCSWDATAGTSLGKPIRVRLNIDFQERQENVSIDVDVPEGSNVLSALQAAATRKSFPIQYRGSDATTFVTSIAGVRNEKSAGSNWVFYVNDVLGRESAGTFVLSNNDRVLWKFKANGLE